jgi:hypothetical protein
MDIVISEFSLTLTLGGPFGLETAIGLARQGINFRIVGKLFKPFVPDLKMKAADFP